MKEVQYGATLNQCGLFSVHTLGGHFATSTNVCFQVEFDGKIDVGAFRDAFARVARAHDAFRTSFHRVARTLVARVATSVELPCPEHDLRGLDAVARGAALEGLARKDASEPFDLEAPPLARMQIAWTSNAGGVALFAFHHIVVDGASAAIFWRAFCSAYADVCLGKADTTEPSPEQMSAFALAEEEVRRADGFRPGLDRWRAALSGPLAFPIVTLGSSIPALGSPFGVEASASLSPVLAASLRALARSRRTTPFVVVLAAVKALVARLTGVEDGTVFSTFANRKTMRSAIGYLVNTLPLRDVIGPDDSFATVLERVDATVRDARDGAHVPFSLIAQELMPPESGAPFPLLNVLVDSPPVEYEEAARAETNGVRMRLASTRSPLAAQLSVSVFARVEATRVSFKYAGTAADQEPLRALACAFARLLEGALATPDAPLASLELTTPAERTELLALGRGAPLTERADLVGDRVREAAARWPDAVAFVGGAERLTHRELARRIAGSAGLLRSALPARFVLVATTGLPAAIAVLTALHLGVPWICVDPTQGRARLARALEVCAPAVVVVDDDSRASFAGSSLPLVAASSLAASVSSHPAPAGTPRAADLAYGVLTSGTTGEPKLVGIEHGALASQIAALLQTTIFGERPTMALLAPLTFDASLEQLLIPLVTGGCVVVPDRGVVADPSTLWSMLAREEVTVLDAIPSLVRAMLPSAPPGTSLSRFVLGGEPLPVELVNAVGSRFPGVRVFDTYGPTEATINATFAEADGERAAIGRPLPGFSAYVVDRELRLLPRGLVGQLVLAGPCLARGYLGDVAATDASFVPSPLASGERIYLTGDRARWGDDGRLVSFGRTDGQVKIRGVRVDLHEVEHALLRCAGIVESVAVRHESNGRARLALVYVATASTPGRRALRARLAEELPRGMVPDILLPLAALPRLPSGKLDPNALAHALSESAPPPSSTAIRIRPHERETTICECMRLALGLETAPDATDDFFELGGDSLALIAFLAHLAAEGLLLNADEVRSAGTARMLARACRVTPRAANLPPSFAEAQRMLGGFAPAFAAPPARVLLTGATGLFGVHLLDQLLQRTQAQIVCIVRADGEEAARQRLLEAWSRAFGQLPLDPSRVTALPGDVRIEQDLGLSPRARAMLVGTDTIVHSAAHVGWLADQALLEATNVAGTAHVARLARDLGARFHYVSTASVAYADARELPYVASKVKAERVVLEADVPARIWRIGLLAGRLRDGAFPLAASEDNGLLLLLSTLLDRSFGHDDARIAQARRAGAAIELTPVDVCAEMMARLLLCGEDLEAITVLKHDQPFELRKLDRVSKRLVPPLARRLPVKW